MLEVFWEDFEGKLFKTYIKNNTKHIFYYCWKKIKKYFAYASLGNLKKPQKTLGNRLLSYLLVTFQQPPSNLLVTSQKPPDIFFNCTLKFLEVVHELRATSRAIYFQIYYFQSYYFQSYFQSSTSLALLLLALLLPALLLLERATSRATTSTVLSAHTVSDLIR